MEIDSDVVINFVHSQYDTHAFPIGFIAALHHPLNWHVTPVAAALSTLELIHNPAEGWMRRFLSFTQFLNPPARHAIPRRFETKSSSPHQAGVPKQVRAARRWILFRKAPSQSKAG